MNLSCEDSAAIYRFEQYRLESFVHSNWPTFSPVKCDDLARAGFFYTGNTDRVQCAFCRQILGQWSPGDTPDGEHRRHNPYCPFLLNPQEVGNVPVINDIQRSSLPENFHTPIQESQGQGGQLTEESLSDRPVYFQYSTYDNRLATFITYPQNRAQTPVQLAEAGFFYTGEDDNVKCFFCDGGLRSWDPVDNPWTEHARWFPRCGFLKLAKGEEFVKQIQATFERLASGEGATGNTILPNNQPVQLIFPQHGFQPTATAESYQPQSIQSGETVLKVGAFSMSNTNFNNMSSGPSSRQQLPVPRDDTRVKTVDNESMDVSQEFTGLSDTISTTTTTIATTTTATATATATDNKDSNSKDSTSSKELEKTIQDLEEERTCKICMDAKANVVFLDCGHVVCCEDCGKQVRKCPMCRKLILKLVKIYMS